MIEKSAKRQKKAAISEQDVASLLQRYTPKTVLAVLHEVSQCTDAKKIDWNALVQKTSTGISSAREYQMLWRHLAYRHTLLDKLDDDAQPLDDDSDLEFEMEAFPSVNGEASAEAAVCVKVLTASAIPSDSNPNGSIVEAPLTINIPNFQPSRDLEQPSCSMQGTNVIVSVFVQKQPTPVATVADGLDKRKRKPWSEAEDLELIAAVQKCGEGNWAHMLRGDFKGDRTASQLSQRWGIIRKRHVNRNAGSNSTNGPKLSESQLATSHALFLALDMPVNNLTSNSIGRGGTVGTFRSAGTCSRSSSARTNGTNNTQLGPLAAETSSGGNKLIQSQKPAQDTSKPSPIGSSGPTEKSRAPVKKTMMKPTPAPKSSDAMVRATAVAAGARIASPSDAESLLKAAQAKNAVHIMPSGGGSIKSSMPGGAPSISENLPNVHYIRTGLARPPLANYAAATPSIPIKTAPTQVKPLPTTNGASSDVPAKLNNDVTLACQVSSKEVKTTEVASVTDSDPTAVKEQIQGNGTCVSEKSQEVVQDNKVSSSVPSVVSKGTSGTEYSAGSLNLKKAESNSAIESPVSVSGAKNSVALLNLKTADVKGTSGTENPVNFSNLKTAEVKGSNGAPNPVSSSTSKTAEVKGTNCASNRVSLSTSKTAEVKGTHGASNPVSLSTSTAEVKGTNGASNPVSLSTSKTAEVKGKNAAPNPVSLSTSKTAEVISTNGAPNPVSLSTSKTAEVNGMNGAPKPVSLSTSKTAEVKCTNGTPNPVSSLALKIAGNSKQVIVDTQSKKAEENGKGDKASGSQPQACEDKDAKVEQSGQNQHIDKMEEDHRSVVTDNKKNMETVTEKMEVDIPRVVAVVEKNDENHGAEKMEEDLQSAVPGVEKNGENQNRK